MFKQLTKRIVLPALVAGSLFFTINTTANAALGDQTLVNGMTGDDVQVLQQDLKSFKFLDIDKVTNYYGDATEQAVRRFQDSQNLKVTGTYDKNTHDNFEIYKANRIKSMVANNELLIYERNLSLESKGSDVKNLQEKLKELGFLKIDNCTDYYGNITRDAVKDFQETYELSVDGTAGPRTIDAINNVLLGRLPRKEAPNRSSRSRGSEGIVNTALNLKGARYSYGSSGPNAFDCSGFTTYVYGKHGIKLPRSSSGQAYAGTQVSKSDLQPGDLIIFSNTYRRGPSHVGVYIGDGNFIHASTSSRGVVVDSLASGYYSSKFTSGRRFK